MDRLRNRWLYAGATAAAAAGLAVAAVGAPALAQDDNDQDTAQVSIVHGIPDQPVDVYLNGEEALTDLEPGTVEGPMDLPADSYDIVLTEPGGSADDPLVSLDGAEVTAGDNLSIVAHLTEEGDPVITVFVNELTDESGDEGGQEGTPEAPATPDEPATPETTPEATPDGNGDQGGTGGQAEQYRVTVRHVAAAPAVDVRSGDQELITDLSNPDEETVEAETETVEVEVLLAGEDTVVLGPEELTLSSDGLTVVYVIGSADAGNLQVLTQELSETDAMPEESPDATATPDEGTTTPEPGGGDESPTDEQGETGGFSLPGAGAGPYLLLAVGALMVGALLWLAARRSPARI